MVCQSNSCTYFDAIRTNGAPDNGEAYTAHTAFVKDVDWRGARGPVTFWPCDRWTFSTLGTNWL